MSTFAAAAIPQADLVTGKLYAVLLLCRNVWTYGIYNGDHVRVNATAKMPIFTMRNPFTGMDQVMARTGTGTFDYGEALFYPVTHDVETMVHTQREVWRVHDGENGGGWLDIVRLNRVGWTLEDFAFERRKHALAGWAAVYAARMAEETGEMTAWSV